MAEQTALKDEVYYWLDNIRFLVSSIQTLGAVFMANVVATVALFLG